MNRRPAVLAFASVAAVLRHRRLRQRGRRSVGGDSPELRGAGREGQPDLLQLRLPGAHREGHPGDRRLLERGATPNIHVDYQKVDPNSVHDKLVTQFAGNSAPDIIHDESADIAGFSRQGYLADLGTAAARRPQEPTCPSRCGSR